VRPAFRSRGRENIPGEACVLYWKHESVFEIMAGVVLFPQQTWVVKRELMWIPIFGWGLAMLKPIAINRKAGHSAVKQVMARGRSGWRAG
jgi:1-acyl-sn-glycerol-3-phosphate acyltransferase